MNCKNLKKRTKMINKKRTIYYYCSLLKKKITFDNCKGCVYKEYKKLKMHNNCKNNVLKNKKCTVKPKSLCKIKGKKHKSTKATEIPMKVKQKVWERDNHQCVYCHKDVSVYCANSHYIKRSQLGLGIPQNIVTACQKCHDKYDFGTNVEDMIEYTKNYLKSKYNNWNECELKYRK